MHAHDENARERRPLVGDRQVERGEAEIAAELRAVHDVAADHDSGGRARRARASRSPATNAARTADELEMRAPDGSRDRGHLLDFETVVLALPPSAT